MHGIRKVLLILALSVLVPSITAYAVTVFTLTVPSTVNVTLAPGLTMYSYSSGCTTTVVTTISFTAAQGDSEKINECLENTGGASYWITSSSFSTTLASSVGTITVGYNNTGGSPLTLPIQMFSNNEMIVGFLLSPANNAPTGTTSFNIAVSVYSTSSG